MKVREKTVNYGKAVEFVSEDNKRGNRQSGSRNLRIRLEAFDAKAPSCYRECDLIVQAGA